MSIAGWKWWTDNGKFAFAYSNGDGTFSPDSDSGDTVYLDCAKTYTYLTLGSSDLEAELELPVEFQMDVVAGVIADLYQRPGKDLKMSAVFREQFERAVGRGQERASMDSASDGMRTASGIF